MHTKRSHQVEHPVKARVQRMPAGKRETGERRERAGAIRLDASLDDVERARDQG